MQIRLKPKVAAALTKEIERLRKIPPTTKEQMLGGRKASPTTWVNELVAAVLLNITKIPGNEH